MWHVGESLKTIYKPGFDQILINLINNENSDEAERGAWSHEILESDILGSDAVTFYWAGNNQLSCSGPHNA